MPFYIDTYMADTSHLSTLEHGAYMLLLFAAWRRPACDLPDDDRLLAKYAKQPLNRWKEKLRPIIEPFFEVSGGAWRQKKQASIREHLGAVADKRRGAAAASRGANPLVSKGPALANAGANAPESKTITKPKEDSLSAAPGDSVTRDGTGEAACGQVGPVVSPEIMLDVTHRACVLGLTPAQVRD